MSDEPTRDYYDADLGLYPPQRPAEVAYAVVKFTHDFSSGDCRVAGAETLDRDVRSEEVDDPLAPGSDYHFYKPATDVIVRGSAYPLDGEPTPVSRVRIGVGDHEYRIRVFGPRMVTWSDRGNPHFGRPAPFEEIEMSWENAYGGADRRVEPESPLEGFKAMRLEYDHPGLYPRNPFGKGYFVRDEPLEGIELPNLEDPDDLLTEEAFVVGEPQGWFRQPRPVNTDWVHPLMFPRFVFAGCDAWFPGPEDRRMPEVDAGILPEGYRQEYIESQNDPTPALPFFQEAPPGLVFEEIRPETPVWIEGMHPEGRPIQFHMPRRPRFELEIDGERREPSPRLLQVVIRPEDEVLTCTYGLVTMDLPRKFIPGIHGDIPFSLRVHGDTPVQYETPPTVREQVADGRD